MLFEYDVVIIGGGAAGLAAAHLARELGKTVALIERSRLGGTCFNTGCIPSKTLIHTAKVVHNARLLEHMGIRIDQLATDTIMSHVRSVVNDIYQHFSAEKLEAQGIKVHKGEAEFIDPYHIRCNEQVLFAKTFIIASGSKPLIPDIEGIENVPYLTNESFFNLKKLPSSLLILGGGPNGIESACVQRLGTSVTVVEKNHTILPREDEELAYILASKMMKEGVDIKTSYKVTKASADNGSVTLECVDRHNKRVTLYAEALLLCVGRKPDIEQLNLKKAGVEYTQKAILVNDILQTTASHIYACGDVAGPYPFSNMAEYQARIATCNALQAAKKKVTYRHHAWVTFSDPEFATCGLTEDEAKKEFKDITVIRSYYKDSDRAHTDSQMTGLAKFICDKKGYILGAHILGARAGELIGEVQLGAIHNLKLTQFHEVIYPYPTYSHIIWKASKKAYHDGLSKNGSTQILRWLADRVQALKLFFKRTFR